MAGSGYLADNSMWLPKGATTHNRRLFIDYHSLPCAYSCKLSLTNLPGELLKPSLGCFKKIESQHRKGKLTARERIAYLIDSEKPFVEIGLFVGEGTYEEHGGWPKGDYFIVATTPYLSNIARLYSQRWQIETAPTARLIGGL